MDQTDAPAAGRRVGALVATSVAVAAVDLIYLGVAVTFGPSGFGGTATCRGARSRPPTWDRRRGCWGVCWPPVRSARSR